MTIERREAEASDFMDGIFSYTRGLIESSTSAKLDTDRWGDCPLCGKEIVKGKHAYGCSGWKDGCPFVLETNYKGLLLTPNQVQVLLQMHLLPYPVHIEEQPRLLLLSKQGFVMDIDLPAADRQKSGKDNARPAKTRKPIKT